jgi:hypothetical protein
MAVPSEGTVTFRMSHAHSDWPINNAGYSFGPYNIQGVEVKATKLPDRTLMIEIEGPLNTGFLFQTRIASGSSDAILAVITWTEHEISLYLDGVLIQTITP